MRPPYEALAVHRRRYNRKVIDRMVAEIDPKVQEESRNLVGNSHVDPSYEWLVSSAVIRDCVVTDSRLSWVKTNKTGRRRVSINRAVQVGVHNSLDQRLTRLVNVRVTCWYRGVRRGLVWNFDAFEMALEPAGDDT